MAELRALIAACGADPRAALARELGKRGAGINRAKIGALYHGDPIIVGADEIRSFAEATNDPNPMFVDGARAGGLIAPPLFPVRYFNLIYGKVLLDPELRVDVARLLFGEMELRFLAPVRPRDLVVCKARIQSVDDKDSGQVARVATRLMCEGEVKAEGVASFFLRWSQPSRIRKLQEARAAAASEERAVVFEEPMTIRDDQTRLFAKAANDPNPVHLDDGFARAAGLPGIIVHGLCSMSFASRAFVQRAGGGDPASLLALRVRFSKPARPGQTLTTRAFSPTVERDRKRYAFEATNEAGDKIITDGVAEVRI
jgi:acyl dehydratase